MVPDRRFTCLGLEFEAAKKFQIIASFNSFRFFNPLQSIHSFVFVFFQFSSFRLRVSFSPCPSARSPSPPIPNPLFFLFKHGVLHFLLLFAIVAADTRTLGPWSLFLGSPSRPRGGDFVIFASAAATVRPHLRPVVAPCHPSPARRPTRQPCQPRPPNHPDQRPTSPALLRQPTPRISVAEHPRTTTQSPHPVPDQPDRGAQSGREREQPHQYRSASRPAA